MKILRNYDISNGISFSYIQDNIKYKFCIDVFLFLNNKLKYMEIYSMFSNL